MDEANSGTPQQDPNAQTAPTGATATQEPAVGNLLPPLETTTASGTIVDKTLGEIASGEVKKIESNIKDTVDTDVAKVEAKVNHEVHGILDELEAHLSQFDARVVTIYHGFLQRLRNAV